MSRSMSFLVALKTDPPHATGNQQDIVYKFSFKKKQIYYLQPNGPGARCSSFLLRRNGIMGTNQKGSGRDSRGTWSKLSMQMRWKYLNTLYNHNIQLPTHQRTSMRTSGTISRQTLARAPKGPRDTTKVWWRSLQSLIIVPVGSTQRDDAVRIVPDLAVQIPRS